MSAKNPTQGLFSKFFEIAGTKINFFLQGLFSKQVYIAGTKNIFKPKLQTYL
jgi:hypothetical protein